MSKYVIMIHGCPDDKEKALDPERRTYNKHWMPWFPNHGHYIFRHMGTEEFPELLSVVLK